MNRTLAGLAMLLVLLAVGCNQTSTTHTTSTATGGTESPPSAAAPNTTTSPAPGTSAPSATSGQEQMLPGGLKYVDETVGDGAIAEAGKTVSVHYTGWLTDGTKFDSSLDRGQPFSFRLGAGQVIRGWDQGVSGMRVGGKRKLTIPPDLGYGASGSPPVIPPNATLVFEVQLLGVQ